MKRFLLFVVLGIIAIYWLRTHAALREQARAHQAYRQALALEDYQRQHPAAPGRIQYVPTQPIPREVTNGQLAQRESVGDIPVPIVPGTRVTEAEARPPQSYSPFPPPPSEYPTPQPQPIQPYQPWTASRPETAPPPPSDQRAITGQLSATRERAIADARRALDRQVVEWVAPEVPVSWQVPARLIDAMVLETQVKSVEKDLGTLYEATIRASFSPDRRQKIVETYSQEVVAHRLTLLAGLLAFVLSCLAALAGYIRADEATKGYYTNRLRLASAAGVGAAGVLIYQILA